MLGKKMEKPRTQLEETFTFLRRAGRGAFGTAWLALDRRTGEKVLVKTVSKLRSSREAFKRELKYAVHLSSHENITSTYKEAYESDGNFILVSEYASGGDLFDAIRADVGMSQVHVRRYASQLASALAFMHSHGLVHRDVKPENAVLVPQASLAGKVSVLKLIDFGMTRREGTTVSSMPKPTPYSAPEICLARDAQCGYTVSKALDVWSLGITLFCMLTGTFPWDRAMMDDELFAEFADWQTGETNKVPSCWLHFSPQLLQLFKSLLCITPSKRCSVSKVQNYLKVPWFRNSLDFSNDVCTLDLKTDPWRSTNSLPRNEVAAR